MANSIPCKKCGYYETPHILCDPRSREFGDMVARRSDRASSWKEAEKQIKQEMKEQYPGICKSYKEEPKGK